MAGTNRGTFFSGAGLVWKWQRLVWWIFAVCLIFAHFSTQGMVDRAADTLNHSLASQRLVNGFDLSAFINLQQLPDSPLEIQGPTIVHFSVVFLVFMLFATGGILLRTCLTKNLRQRFSSRPAAATSGVFSAC